MTNIGEFYISELVGSKFATIDQQNTKINTN